MTKKEIKWEEIDGYLLAGCSGVTIAQYLGICPDTLYNRCKSDFNMTFDLYSQSKKKQGIELIKAKQFEIAMQGDKTMLIWLGKQYCDQNEKQDVTSNGQTLTPIIIDWSGKSYLNDTEKTE
jgi:hypothetical protein